MTKNDRTCVWCGERYVVPSLARYCEDKHNDELRDDDYDDGNPAL